MEEIALTPEELELGAKIMGWSEEQVIERSVTAIKYAKDNGLFVNFFPYDTTRANFSFLSGGRKRIVRSETLLVKINDRFHRDVKNSSAHMMVPERRSQYIHYL